MPNHHDIVVIGGSSGAIEALLRIVPDLPVDLPATVFIVLHLSPNGPSTLPHLLTTQGNLPAHSARHDAPFRPGNIYLAPPDYHLILEKNRMLLSHGARQNGFRPAIDPLFRSAAHSFGSRVIGLMLSGDLDDGTTGLIDIKLHGGIALAQDPADAAYPSMPRSAVANVELDHVVPLHKIAARLTELVHTPVGGKTMRTRKNLATNQSPDSSDKSALVPGADKPRHFTCPDCGGSMWELTGDNQLRFRCHTGHTHTAETLSQGQANELEQAIWASIRSLQEAAELRRRMAARLERGALNTYANEYLKTAEEADSQATVLRSYLERAHARMDQEHKVERASSYSKRRSG